MPLYYQCKAFYPQHFACICITVSTVNREHYWSRNGTQQLPRGIGSCHLASDSLSCTLTNMLLKNCRSRRNTVATPASALLSTHFVLVINKVKNVLLLSIFLDLITSSGRSPQQSCMSNGEVLTILSVLMKNKRNYQE